ncbi:hypothetical protein E4U40_006262 [Claviceps sp. LM458 group G5]|nr:hypothetical protein E4U40_006262 [Claviceps sp. LM458 group G5]
MDTGHVPQQAAGETENLLPSDPPPVLSCPISYEGRPNNLSRHTQSTKPPEFRVVHDDPVTVALSYAKRGIRVPFICAAHSIHPDVRHQDVRPTYEEEFCHRSNLRDTLTRKWPGMDDVFLYPIPATGGIFSNRVAVYLCPRENNYEYLNPIPDLPVVSVPPVLRPRGKRNGSLYLYEEDKFAMEAKIRGALRVCLYHKYDRVVIGDFGLGDGYHNPPQAVAEIWRHLFLFDPDLCGQFKSVDFAFVDPMQSTTQWFQDERQKRNERGRARRAAEQGTTSTSTKHADSSQLAPTDMAIFESVFDETEIKRVLERAALINRCLLSWEI